MEHRWVLFCIFKSVTVCDSQTGGWFESSVLRQNTESPSVFHTEASITKIAKFWSSSQPRHICASRTQNPGLCSSGLLQFWIVWSRNCPFSDDCVIYVFLDVTTKPSIQCEPGVRIRTINWHLNAVLPRFSTIGANSVFIAVIIKTYFILWAINTTWTGFHKGISSVLPAIWKWSSSCLSLLPWDLQLSIHHAAAICSGKQN